MNKHSLLKAGTLPTSLKGEAENNVFSSAVLFYIVSVCLTLPLIDVPLLGLSLSAPLFFFVAMEAILRPPLPWSNIYRPYITLALLIWAGVFLSAMVNGLLSGGTNINSEGVSTLIHYAYWLLFFIVVIYIVSIGNLLSKLVKISGWSILLLAILRWGEVMLYGNIGAWTRTHLLLQNDYGFQFSIFSPFLLGLALSERGWKKNVAMTGNILLWGAAAINGSRGSWIAIGISTLLFLIILIAARRRSFLGLTVSLILIGSVSFLVYSSSPQISQAVESRLNTFQNLDEEKSYMIRTLMNQKSLRLFEQSPVFGIGTGRFRVTSIELDLPQVLKYGSQEHFNVKSSHNAYLGFLAENGLVGAIPLALLLIVLATHGFKAAIYLLRQNQYWGVTIFCGFVGMSAHLWVISALTNTVTWFIYGMVAAIIILTRQFPEGHSK